MGLFIAIPNWITVTLLVAFVILWVFVPTIIALVVTGLIVITFLAFIVWIASNTRYT